MTRRKRGILLAAVIPIGLVGLFLITADYGDDAQGVHHISRPAVASVTWGPAERYIVREGVNIARDRGGGMAGNFVEFPVSPHTRVSMRLFSVRWYREELAGWVSDHPRIARWLGWNPCPEEPAPSSG